MIRRSKVTDLPMKLCNRCWNETVVYEVDKNAPICEDCYIKFFNPNYKKKKIPNEKSMITNLLLTTQQSLLNK